ncbi:MAG: hypothetical protein FJ119_01510 [Deltaproteobacteria bacterium]|nr:hypothetical protein [Deltaproteobacteria bacterium]
MNTSLEPCPVIGFKPKTADEHIFRQWFLGGQEIGATLIAVDIEIHLFLLRHRDLAVHQHGQKPISGDVELLLAPCLIISVKTVHATNGSDDSRNPAGKLS